MVTESSLATVAAALAPRYAVRSTIGRGGVATVYLADDTERGEPVAVKVLHAELAATIHGRRFRREIRVLDALEHPNILPILDTPETEQVLSYVMPYARDDSLRSRIEQRGALALPDVTSIVRDLAAALDYAHAMNVVHRDIKPENVLFDRGRTLLCDFGIARALVAAAGDRITSAGYAVGTPSYMSPEQAHDAEISARTDLYALGCVVFEMLTGDPPFTGPTPQAIIARHLSQPPRSIRIVRPDVPAYAESAVRAAMSKQAADRPATATEFLRRFINDL